MKIGILTQPLHNNYGGLLQNYALQQVLKGLGHEVETVDWMPASAGAIKTWLWRKKHYYASCLKIGRSLAIRLQIRKKKLFQGIRTVLSRDISASVLL